MIRTLLIAGIAMIGQGAVAQTTPTFDASQSFEVQQVLARDTALVQQGRNQFRCVWDDSTATTGGAFVEIRNCVPVVAKSAPAIAEISDPFLAKVLIAEASEDMMKDGFIASMQNVGCVLDLNRYDANRAAFAGPLLKVLGIDARISAEVADDVDKRLEGILESLGNAIVLDRSAGELRMVRGCN